MFWENEEFSQYLFENEKYLKDFNVITIEFKKISNFKYFKQLLIYSSNDDESIENLEKELNRWKSLFKN
jgi:hypothetical protein